MLRACPSIIRVFALFLAALASERNSFAAPEGAALPPEKAGESEADSWFQLQTPHFLLCSHVSEKTTRDFADDLENFRETLARLFPRLVAKSPVPVMVYLFKDPIDFQPFRRRVQGAPIEDRGYFHAGAEGNYLTVADASGPGARRVIRHEYAHFFLHNNFARIPLWLDEGMADFLSGFRVSEQGVEIGVPILEHLAWLSTHAQAPPSHIFRFSQEALKSDAPGERAAFYAQSWALVHCLIHGQPASLGLLSDFVRRLGRGEGTDRALQETYGKSGKELERASGRYTVKSEFRPMLVDRAASGPALPAAIRALGPAGAFHRLGCLLLQHGPNRAGDAERYFREGMEKDPSFSGNRWGLGRVELMAGRKAEALSQFSMASSLRPEDAAGLYLFADLLSSLPGSEIPETLLSQVGKDMQGAPRTVLLERQLLHRAIAVDPEFAPALALLGSSYLTAGGDRSEGIACLEKALDIEPTNTRAAVDLVGLYSVEGKPDQAAKVVEALQDRNIDPEILDILHKAVDEGKQECTDSTRPTGTVQVPGAESWAGTSLKSVEDLVADPAMRRAVQERYESIMEMPTEFWGEVVLNQAVDLANHSEYRAAIKLLEGLLPRATKPKLAEATKSTLARVKQDAQGCQAPKP